MSPDSNNSDPEFRREQPSRSSATQPEAVRYSRRVSQLFRFRRSSPEDAGVRPGPFGQAILLSFAVVALIALLPMFFTHLRNVSRLPHREHALLVLFGFTVCVFRRWDRDRVVTIDCREFSIADVLLLLFGMGVFALATAIRSPWLGTVSMICVAGLLLRRLPSVGNRGYFGPWACLMLLLPLPLGLDQKLVQSMQVAATGWSSRLLDTIGVRHLISGNVLEIPGHRLFVDQACSGIQSLFVMLTCIALFCAWTRRPTVLTVPLLLSGLVMCLVSNVIRITVVVLASARGLDLSDGWQHQALGLAVFAMALFLVYCSEGLFLFLLAPVMNPATGSPDNRVARRWNDLTAAIHTTLLGIPEDELPIDRSHDAFGWVRIPTALSRVAVVSCTVGFAVLGVSQQVAGTEAAPTIKRLSEFEAVMLDRSEALSKESLPEALGGWRQTSFERIEGSSGTLTDSVTWVYESPFYRATVALDYPFFHAHNVTECYHLSGWDVQNRVTTDAGFSRATLHQPFGRMALLFYDVFDSGGNVELETASGRLEERLGLGKPDQRAIWQFQMIVETDYGLTESDMREIETRFAELRSNVRSYITGESLAEEDGQ